MNAQAFPGLGRPMSSLVTVETVSLTALFTSLMAGLTFLLKWRGAGYSELHKTCETLQQQILQLHERINRANQMIQTAEERAAAAEKRAANADAGRIAVEKRMAVIEAKHLEAMKRARERVRRLHDEKQVLVQQLEEAGIAPKKLAPPTAEDDR